MDSKEQLMLVETGEGTFGGYKQNMLVIPLDETQIEFYVCTKCKGIMRNACESGEEQNLICGTCVGSKRDYRPMKKARQKIPELKTNCPLATRGCAWNATLFEVESHLDVCHEFNIKCKDGCGVVLKRCEQKNHCSNECLNRLVRCEHCQNEVAYRDLKQHHKECLEFPLLCPNNCGANLTRKQTDPHIETDCPNAIVRCPYERFGCREVVRRCEMDQHSMTNEVKHLKMTAFFAVNKIEQQERTISQLKGILVNVVESLTFLVVLRGNINSSNLERKSSFSVPSQESRLNEFPCQPHKFELQFKNTRSDTVTITVLGKATYRGLMDLQRGDYEGRFKLTIIDRININNSLAYETPFTQLKNPYSQEFEIASIPRELLLEKRFRKGNGDIEFILQTQDNENIMIQDRITAGIKS